MSEYEELPPRYRDGMMRVMKEEAPYWELLGMEFLEFKKGWAKVRLPFAERLLNPTGLAHGGAIFSVADSAVAMAAMGVVQKGEIVTTVEMKINYLRPFYEGEIVAEARIAHRGANLALGDVEVKNAKGELIARALSTCMILERRKGIGESQDDTYLEEQDGA